MNLAYQRWEGNRIAEERFISIRTKSKFDSSASAYGGRRWPASTSRRFEAPANLAKLEEPLLSHAIRTAKPSEAGGRRASSLNTPMFSC